MDPSAAPWRVLEAGEPSNPAGVTPSATTSPVARSLPVSTLTVAAALGVLLLAIAAFVLAASGDRGGVVQVSGDSSLAPFQGSAGDAGSAGPGTDLIVVEIVGAVRSPGVFKLAVGSRIGDLVEAAGGFGPRLDAARATLDLNMAARLADGDRVVVPSRDDVASSTSGASSGTEGGGSDTGGGAVSLVDLNRATSSELEALPGVGPVTAGKIITAREEQPFTAVEDLRTRKLVGAKTFEGLKDLVSVR